MWKHMDELRKVLKLIRKSESLKIVFLIIFNIKFKLYDAQLKR